LDTIPNLVSASYRWEFVFSLALGTMILEEVMDLVGCTKQGPVPIPFLVMKLPISLADERAHGDSELMVDFLPKRVGA
jgi:hypothetical protein